MLPWRLLLRSQLPRRKEEREHYKHLKYDILAAEEKSMFVAFVLESVGAFGKEALKFIKRLVKSFSACLFSPGPKGYFRGRIFRALSVCLQKGNALIELLGCRQARQSAGVQVGFPTY